MYGKITVNNDTQSPEYSGHGWLLEGFFRDVGPISGELSFNTRGSLLNIKKFTLEKTESTSIVAKGQIDLATQKVDVTIAGSKVDVNDVTKIIANKDGLIRGDAIVQVGLRGALPEIPIFGDVKFHNLKILKFNFDEAIWDFGDSEHRNGSYLSKREINIGHAVFGKFDEFTLEGTGKLGFRGEEQLELELSGDGNFLSVLSDIDDFFVKTSSRGHLDLYLAGKYKKPNFTGSRFKCENGVLKLRSVTKKVENITADFEVLPEDYFLNIHELQGTIQGDSISISNSNLLTGLNHNVYEPLKVGDDDLNLGALIFKTSPNGIQLNIPGLMEKGEIGRFSLHGRSEKESFFVAGPWQRPYVRGEIHVQNANLIFPFEGGGDNENSVAMNILNNINWDVAALPGKDTRYVKQFPAGIYVNMEIDKESSNLEFSGVLEDSTFRINGDVQSTRGDFEYVDLNFRVQKFGANFDHSSLYPVLHGKAWTVLRDTTGTPNDVYLELYTVDDLTNQEFRQGRWNRVKIKLSSEYPGYEETQADIMETLGYSSETVEEQATKAVGYSTDKFIFRPLMRPLERELEQTFGLDVVRFSYAITRNFLDANFNNEQLSSSLELLRSSRVSLGKYLTEDLYFLYTGELKTGIDYQFQDKGVGLQHVLGLEYRLNSKWLLQMEYDYNTLLETHKDDKKIWLRHSFPLGDLN
ncbi:hypothetical protein GWO43_26525 [candidate division KSB1 bacterium]|nr:hypothetical protein [candidate division KSB1 bacterium]NIR70072.1 hypothetical protein [candidate division KSB1 bacterium]NIS27510.1 hypothetical protein [candidate division KSB1 bacterium]NIT74359.1 hypothetical protein [candidate division KSB1 bacterium]NIU28228.1 hypothetical protein [candidate division KSB1 bacterium]